MNPRSLEVLWEANEPPTIEAQPRLLHGENALKLEAFTGDSALERSGKAEALLKRCTGVKSSHPAESYRVTGLNKNP